MFLFFTGLNLQINLVCISLILKNLVSLYLEVSFSLSDIINYINIPIYLYLCISVEVLNINKSIHSIHSSHTSHTSHSSHSTSGCLFLLFFFFNNHTLCCWHQSAHRSSILQSYSYDLLWINNSSLDQISEFSFCSIKAIWSVSASEDFLDNINSFKSSIVRDGLTRKRYSFLYDFYAKVLFWISSF